MMLRPATPLTILLFAAFVLLLISTISAPVVKSIPLAEHEGVNMGVFGYCKGNQCSKFEVGYDPTAALGSDSYTHDFNVPLATRRDISAILIIHPIACFFTLIMLILAGVSHMHSASHSPRYLLGVFILSILTLLLALLAFLIDVLLFVPHMAWGSYIVLAATVLIAASGVVSCAMRRTLVSRKARKRRIAENAEMNGENYYNRQAAVAPADAPIPPSFDGGRPGNDNLPAFATFESHQENQTPVNGSEDDRIPLTTRTRSPSEQSPEAGMASLAEQAGPMDRYNNNSQPGSNVGSGVGSQRGFAGEPRRDQYGNVILPAQGQGYGAVRGDPRNPFGGNNGSQGNYRGRGGPGGFRGRGGAPGYGRGGYGGQNPAPYGQEQRGTNAMAAGALGAVGGAMISGGRGGRGPPPGYSNHGYGRGGRNESSRGQLPENYGPGGYNQSQAGPYGGPARSESVTPHQTNNAYGMAYGGHRESLARAESPPPLDDHVGLAVGQAMEMDAQTGARSPRDAPQSFVGQYGNVRDSDSDVQGMVNLQQQRLGPIGPNGTVISDGSKYSQDLDVYGAQPQAYSRVNSPLAPQQTQRQELGPSPIGSAIGASSSGPPHRRHNSGDNYYEDVDPRFVQPGTEGPIAVAELPHSKPQPVPAALVPGYARGANPLPEQSQIQQNMRVRGGAGGGGMGMDGSNSVEDLHDGPGARSPSESERSNFTSVSQRGINPRWPGNAPQMPTMSQGAMRGGPGGYGGGQRRAPPVQRNEVLLESNPDFQLPGMGARARRLGAGSNGGHHLAQPGQGNQGRFSPNLGHPLRESGYEQPGGAL